MDENQISAFIDDQLPLDEKIGFVEAVHADRSFKEETVQLLRQEIRLREPPARSTPSWCAPVKPFIRSWRRFEKLGWFGGGLAAALLLAAIILKAAPPVVPPPTGYHRFVIYEPDAGKAAIAGSFSDWRELEMERAGEDGYWEITLEIRAGEHRYGYILDDRRHIADPTLEIREPDGFGGFNSILTIGSNNA